MLCYVNYVMLCYVNLTYVMLIMLIMLCYNINYVMLTLC